MRRRRRIRKSIICKLNIVVDLNLPESDVVGGSEVEDSIPIHGLVDSINKNFVESIEEVGFYPITNIPRYVSRRNGGYALYTTFELVETRVKFKLIVDVRVADHHTKNLKKKLEDRKNDLKQAYPEIERGEAECAVIDSYVEEHNGDVHIYFGGPETYSNKPCKSTESANLILVNKLRSLVASNIVEYVDKVLSKYPSDVIEFVEDYLDDVTELKSVEFVNGEIVTVSNEQDMRELKLTYLETGSDDGLFNSVDEFDEICEVLQLSDKYS